MRLLLATLLLTSYSFSQDYVKVDNGEMNLITFSSEYFIPEDTSKLAMVIESKASGINPGGFMRFANIRDESTWMMTYYAMDIVFNFSLNEHNTLNINDLQSDLTSGPYRILDFFDYNQDGHNDLLVHDHKSVYRMQGDGKGEYSSPEKILKIKKGSEPTVATPGVIYIPNYRGPTKMYYSFIDLRNGQLNVIKSTKAQGAIINGYYKNEQHHYVIEMNLTDKLIAVSQNKEVESIDLVVNVDPFEAIVCDLNADGNLDVISANEMNFHIYWGTNNGGLHQGKSQLDPMILKKELGLTDYEHEQMAIWIDRYHSPIIADMNNDGLQDIILYGEYILIFYNQGGDDFKPVVLKGPFDPHKVQLIDLNADGLLDFKVDAVSGMLVFVNEGGSFSKQQLSFEGYVEFSEIVDFDNDGDLDVIMIDGSMYCLWSRNDNGVFQKAEPVYFE